MLTKTTPVYPCYYFRHTFSVANPAQYTSLSLEILRDDGAVVYLNGSEVARYNMPAGTISYTNWASTSGNYLWDAPRSISNLLVTGNNVIAVEIHQGKTNSTDIALDLKLTGTRAVTLSLDSPTQEATEVPVPATLSATATSPGGNNLTVSFYGRPGLPVAPDFTIVVLPDTQNYTSGLNGGTNEMFISQTEWIKANRESLNIAYVAHLGDVSQNGDLDTDQSEWQNAANALYRLESPLPSFPQGIPYGAAVGNHDRYVPTGDTDPTTLYNEYFGVSHFEPKTSYYGGHYGANNNNQYQLFSASGMDFIVIYLEYDTTPDQAVLDWADALLKANSARRGIVVTHYFLETTAAWGIQGLAIYNALKDNPNLFLMLCGHNHGEAQRTDVYDGNTVHTLLSDYQSYPGGGNGYLRVMEFSPANNQIRVKTYSPWLDQYEADANSQFTLNYPMSSGSAFTLVQQNTAVPSGSQTTAAWADLQPTSDYEWYVTANDGVETQTSEIRRFTTSTGTPPNTPPTVTITAPAAGTVYNVEPSLVSITVNANDADGTVTKVEIFAGPTKLGEDDTAPYELTASLANGSFALTAVAHDNGGAQATSTPVHITVATPPTAPTGLAATPQSTTEILLIWTDASANENGFAIYQSVSGESYSLVGTVGPDVTSTVVAGLQPATSYSYVVRAFNAAGYADSAPLSATTPAPPLVPAAPSGLTAAPYSTTEIVLGWTDNSSDETGFRIERSADGAAWVLLGTVPVNSLSATDSGLISGTVYYYRVSACNDAGASQPSVLAAAAPFIDSYATNETAVAAALVGSRANTYANDTIYEQVTEVLSGGKPNTRYSTMDHRWTFNATPGRSMTFFVQAHQNASSEGDQFVFAYSTNNVTYNTMLTVSKTSDDGQYQSFDLPSTLQGTVYVRVQDTDHTVGKTVLDALYVDHLYIRTDASPVITPPSAPVLQQALAGDQSVALAWTASSGATSYTVWRRQAEGDYAAIASGLTATTYTDSGLVNGTTYEYVVTAVNSFGQSAASNALSAAPQAPTFTDPPTNLKAGAGRKKITLTWTQSITPGVTQNVVYRSSNGADYVELTTIAASTSYIDNVPTGVTYFYLVTAISGVEESDAAGPVSATAK